MTCATERSSGAITGAKTIGSVAIRFTGCKSGAKKCTTSGRAEGELETKKLEGALGWESKATRRAALDLYPTGKAGPFMEYTCGGSATTLTGSVLVPIKAGKMAATETLKYKAAKGKQKPEAFEAEAKDVLKNNLEEQVGLTLKSTQTSEEAIEVNTAV